MTLTANKKLKKIIHKKGNDLQRIAHNETILIKKLKKLQQKIERKESQKDELIEKSISKSKSKSVKQIKQQKKKTKKKIKEVDDTIRNLHTTTDALSQYARILKDNPNLKISERIHIIGKMKEIEKDQRYWRKILENVLSSQVIVALIVALAGSSILGAFSGLIGTAGQAATSVVHAVTWWDSLKTSLGAIGALAYGFLAIRGGNPNLKQNFQ